MEILKAFGFVLLNALIMAMYYIFVVLFLGVFGYIILAIVDKVLGTAFLPAFQIWIGEMQQKGKTNAPPPTPPPPAEWSKAKA